MLTHFPTVTQSAGFQPEPLLITDCSLLIAHSSLLIGVLASSLSRDDEIQYTVTHTHKYITRYEADNRSRSQYLSLTRS